MKRCRHWIYYLPLSGRHTCRRWSNFVVKVGSSLKMMSHKSSIVHAWCFCANLCTPHHSVVWWAIKSGFREVTQLFSPYSRRRWSILFRGTLRPRACLISVAVLKRSSTTAATRIRSSSADVARLRLSWGAFSILRSSLYAWSNLFTATTGLSIGTQIALC